MSDSVIVLGMHRSGTSAATGLLTAMGFDLGGPVIPAVAGVNDKGFFEHAGIVGLNERVLAAIGSSWSDSSALPPEWWASSDIAPLQAEAVELVRRDFGATSRWVLKDPRICRLLPFWRPIIESMVETPRAIICIRDPGEVAASLRKVHGMEPAQAHTLWIRYLVDAERYSRGWRRSLLVYEQLVVDPASALERLYHQLALPPDDCRMSEAVRTIEVDLRHHIASTPADAGVAGLAAACYAQCRQTSSEELCRILGPVEAALEIVERHSECQRKRLWLEQELDRVKATRSWRLTAPARVVWNLLRRRPN